MLSFANAKINLGLNLTEKRSDGYHNLETFFYPVKLYDVIELIDAEETRCVIKGIEIPGNVDDNICLKAFHLNEPVNFKGIKPHALELSCNPV